MVMELIERGNDKKLEEVLEKTPEAGARQDSEGNSPINFAIREGKVRCLEVLMTAGISATDVDGTEMTPATTACEVGQIECLEVLIRVGIDVTAADGREMTPAKTAAENNQEGCMLKLFKAEVKMPEVGAQVTSVGDQFEVVMDNKLKLSNVDLPTLKKLLQECEVKQLDVENGDPRLLKAAQDGNWPRLVELLEAGVKMVRSPDGHLPISWNLDGLANHPKGESVIVGLVQAGRLDLLRTLLDKLKQLTDGHHTVGVCHQLMNKTELSMLMRSEDVDEDLKREAIGILAEEGLSNLPPSNFREGEADQLARAWNSKEGVATVTAEEQLWIEGNKKEEVTTWTDRDAEGEIIGLKIRTDKNGGITQLKTLHGSQWSNWRDEGFSPGDDDKESELILLPGETINCIRTHCGYHRY